MTDDNLDRIKQRLAKLLAIAGDSRANINEAAAAAQQAESIMRKYQLDHSDAVMREVRSGQHLKTATSVASAKTNGTKVKKVPPWANLLGTAVSRFNNCGSRIVYTDSGDVGFKFYGYDNDVDLCKWMFDYLVNTINSLAEGYKFTAEYREHGRSAANSYRRGLVTAILSSISKIQAEKDAEMQASVTGRGLVLVKNEEMLAKWGKGIFETIVLKSSAFVADAFGSGLKDGEKIDVARRAVGNTNVESQKRIG